MSYDPRDKILGEKCGNCTVGEYEKSVDDHPSYVICRTCNAIQLTYIPMKHQRRLHKTPIDWTFDKVKGEYVPANQTFGVFGGRKPVAPVKPYLIDLEALRGDRAELLICRP